MKQSFIISVLALMAFCFQSCEKDTMIYGGEPGGYSGIYFLYGPRYSMLSGGVRVYTYQDSLEYSFSQLASNVKQNTVLLPVNVLGSTADYDRTFRVEVVGGTAVEGVDYLSLEEENVVPANAVKVNLPLVLLRTDKLRTRKLHLTVSLVENEYFKLLLPVKVGGDDQKEMNATHLKIIFSEIYSEPWLWSLFGEDYFGTFTPAKFSFINSLMKWAPADWDDGTLALGKLNYAARKVQAELQRRADTDDPVYEEDHITFMQLAAPYRVDYSKYEN